MALVRQPSADGFNICNSKKYMILVVWAFPADIHDHNSALTMPRVYAQTNVTRHCAPDDAYESGSLEGAGQLGLVAVQINVVKDILELY